MDKQNDVDKTAKSLLNYIKFIVSIIRKIVDRTSIAIIALQYAKFFDLFASAKVDFRLSVEIMIILTIGALSY